MSRDSESPGAGRFLAGFALLSLAAVGVGCAIAAAHGVPAGVWARNLAAWAVGGVAAWGVARRMSSLTVFLLITPVALAATLLNPGLEGVHRWIDIGPVHVNVSMTLLPAAVVALAARGGWGWSWLAGAAMLVLLVTQPDASQAIALAMGMLMIVTSPGTPMTTRRAWGMGVILSAGAVALSRPDPLAPVPEVEGIIGLAWGWSPVAAIVAVVLLAAVVLYPLRLMKRRDAWTPALALAACLAVTALSPAFGAFPVPLVGMGMSPILGFWLGIGALAAAHRAGLARADDREPGAAPR